MSANDVAVVREAIEAFRSNDFEGWFTRASRRQYPARDPSTAGCGLART